jgi:hypothetical protein
LLCIKRTTPSAPASSGFASPGKSQRAAQRKEAQPVFGNPEQNQENTMDAHDFDRITRVVATRLPRRTLAGLLGAASLSAFNLSEATKRKRKQKKKKIKPNDFGCVDVGRFCKNGGQCCSGICTGKKRKRKCRAHDERSCQPGQDSCAGAGASISCTTTAGLKGQCVITTGKAAYCLGSGDCFACTRDSDCVPTFGAGAACIVCTSECSGVTPGSTACAGLAEQL